MRDGRVMGGLAGGCQDGVCTWIELPVPEGCSQPPEAFSVIPKHRAPHTSPCLSLRLFSLPRGQQGQCLSLLFSILSSTLRWTTPPSQPPAQSSLRCFSSPWRRGRRRRRGASSSGPGGGPEGSGGPRRRRRGAEAELPCASPAVPPSAGLGQHGFLVHSCSVWQ